MNLEQFREAHGIAAIARRHFAYDNPSANHRHIGNANLSFAMVWSRQLDPAELGLSPTGAKDAFNQGMELARQGVIPSIIFCGCDQRNYDGARFTAAGVEEVSKTSVWFCKHAGIGYPVYSLPARTEKALGEYGDPFVHRYLAERPEVERLWTETAAGFETRIVGAVIEAYPAGTPVLFDLNFEQMVLLYHLHVLKVERQAIPFEKGAWIPTKGGGVVYGRDFLVAKEFRPDLTVVE